MLKVRSNFLDAFKMYLKGNLIEDVNGVQYLNCINKIPPGCEKCIKYKESLNCYKDIGAIDFKLTHKPWFYYTN